MKTMSRIELENKLVVTPVTSPAFALLLKEWYEQTKGVRIMSPVEEFIREHFIVCGVPDGREN